MINANNRFSKQRILRKLLVATMVLLLMSNVACAANYEPLSDADLHVAMKKGGIELRPYSQPLLFNYDDISRERDLFIEATQRYIDFTEELSIDNLFDDGQFTAALPIAEFLSTLTYHTVSPNGELLFGIAGITVPFLYNFTTGQTRLIKPHVSMSSDYYENEYCFKLCKNRSDSKGSIFIDDDCVIWSDDGQRFLITFPRDILNYFAYSRNILLVDCADATIRPIDCHLESGLSLGDLDKHPEGALFRAVFKDDRNLYVERMVAYDENIEGLGRIWRMNLHNESDRELLFITEPQLSYDMQLWMDNQRIVSSLRDSPDIGISIQDANGVRRISKRIDSELKVALTPKIIDLKGSHAIFLLIAESNAGAYIQYDIAIPFSVDKVDADSLFQFPVIDTTIASDPRLFLVDLSKEQGNVLKKLESAKLYNDEAYLVPSNAVLSPDGEYVLMMVNQYFENHMFLYNLKSGELVEVMLPVEVKEGRNYGRHGAVWRNKGAKGLFWASDGKIVISTPIDGNLLYELVWTPQN
ncbi:MAG: hypothetical protein ACOX7B_09525 [Christensenellales bacterium]|jgi:hypothetical protein